jgi:serine/threonine-protein kinase
MLTPGSVLGDRYRLVSRIAVGGMGEVWRADDALLHRAVAVKVLKPELSQDATFLDRFRNEARSAAAFSHSGIANVFDYGEAVPTGGQPGGPEPAIAYLVMELVDGRPLAEILAREGRLSADRTLDYVGQAAAALQVAHRVGVVHRDIKPGNMLVTADGQVKITDFGIARAASTVPLTQAGMVMGTAQYFSPEQAEGRSVGPPSDVYSLGVVAYECLSGRLPFIADSPVTVAMMQIRNLPPPLPPDVPAAVRGVVERAMAKDPALRYPNGGELAAALAAAREGRFDPGPAFVTPGVGGPVPGPPSGGPWPLAVPAQAPPPHPGVLSPSPPGASDAGPSNPAPPSPGPPSSGPPSSGPPNPGGPNASPPAPLTSGRPNSGPAARRQSMIALVVGVVAALVVGVVVAIWYFVGRDDQVTPDPGGAPDVHVGSTSGGQPSTPAGSGDSPAERAPAASAPTAPAPGLGAAPTGEPSTPPSAGEPSTTRGLAVVDPDQLVGQSAGRVEDELRAKGLRPVLRSPQLGDSSHDTVTALRYPRDHVLSRPTAVPAGATIFLDTTPNLGDNDQHPGEGHHLVQASSNPERQGDQ